VKHLPTNPPGTGGAPRNGQAPSDAPLPVRADRGASTDDGVADDAPGQIAGPGGAPAGHATRAAAPIQPAAAREPTQGRAIRLEVITQDAIPAPDAERAETPELLFVHGAWHGAWCWARLQAMCALGGLRSHAVNLRGHGGSSGHERLRHVHLDEYVADVAQVARELTAPFVLLGHSMGGLVAQRYLSLLEQGRDLPRPQGVVLMATVLPTDMNRILRSPVMTRNLGGWRGVLRIMLRMRLAGDATGFVSSPELVRTMFFTPDTPEQDVVDCFIRLQNESATVFFETQRLARLWQMPPRGEVPILVLGGARDACFPPAALMRLAAGYGATLHLFAGMGHDLMLDQGWEQVADAVMAWTRGLPSPGARPHPGASADRGAQIIPLWPLVGQHPPRPNAHADAARDALGVPTDGGNGRQARAEVHAG
jgi:pimeloyl-ACP methyl ester carboxylesterase